MPAVRSPHRTFRPDTVGSDHQPPPSLQGRANKAQTATPHRCRDRSGGREAALLRACWRDRHKQAASGVDGLTAQADEATLQAHITALVHRLKTHRYRAKRVRRGDMPKANGAERRLGMPARQDQGVQRACAKLLRAIDAQDCRECSDGYRPGRGALEAVRDLPVDRQDGPEGYLVEADGKGGCDQRDQTRLWTMRRERIDDRAFLRLIRQWLKAGVLETDGRVVHPETGSPQGGGLSPGLANVYWHDARDVWVAEEVKTHGRGEALLGREADDWLCAVRDRHDAERLYRG